MSLDYLLLNRPKTKSVSGFDGTSCTDKKRSWRHSDTFAVTEPTCPWFAPSSHRRTTRFGRRWQQVAGCDDKCEIDSPTKPTRPQGNTPRTTISTETSCLTSSLGGSLTATMPTARMRPSGGKMPNPSGRRRPNTARRSDQVYSINSAQDMKLSFSVGCHVQLGSTYQSNSWLLEFKLQLQIHTLVILSKDVFQFFFHEFSLKAMTPGKTDSPSPGMIADCQESSWRNQVRKIFILKWCN